MRLILSTVTLFSILTLTLTANAAPVKFEQVRQIINAKPGKAKTNAFARLSLINADLTVTGEGDDKGKKDDKNKTDTPATEQTQQQDDRVITETTSEIVEDEVCDCVKPIIETKAGFPKFALLGLGAIPLLLLIPHDKDTPTPTPTIPTTQTPTPPTTETPTPTPTPTETPTPPPTVTPTPPEPVPEPMTILLFGTGLASIGMAARKKFGKKEKDKTEE